MIIYLTRPSTKTRAHSSYQRVQT